MTQKSPKSFFLKTREWFFSHLPINDRAYYLFRFWISNKRKLNLKNPVTFCDKLNWLRLHINFQQYNSYVDKLAVREFVKNKVGEKYLVDLYGVYDKPEEINFKNLPEQFIIMANHGSNMKFFCRDKNQLDEDYVKKICFEWLKTDYSKVARENNYRGIYPRILCERLLTNENGDIPEDYRFFCSFGRVKGIQYEIDTYSDHTRNFYTPEWKILPIKMFFPNCSRDIKKPVILGEMIAVAEKLATGFPFVRIDLYNIAGKIYFGEMTFTPLAGLAHISFEHDLLMGSWLDIEPIRENSIG